MVGAQTYENLERLITPGSNNFIRNRLQTS
jgi:hypothetical protein